MATITEVPTIEVATERPVVQARSPRTLPSHRITVERYQRMIAAGIFHEKEPVLLWEGRLVEKMGEGDDHNYCLTAANTLLVRIVPLGWHVRPETPVRIGDYGMPEPDLTVARGANRDYKDRTPAAQDVALVVEVADSSLAVDSGEVLAVYARESIPVYWIVNIPERRIEVHSRPSGPATAPYYGERRSYGPDEEVPVVLDGREVGRVAARDVLP